MHTITKLAIAALSVVPLVPAFADASDSADPEATTKQALIRLEHAWLQALETHDVDALQRILAEDFLDTSYDGQLRTKADQLAGGRDPTIESERLSELRVRVFGDAAIVTGLNTVTGAQHAWTVRIRFTDVFVKRDGRWQAVAAQETLYRTPTQ